MLSFGVEVSTMPTRYSNDWIGDHWNYHRRARRSPFEDRRVARAEVGYGLSPFDSRELRLSYCMRMATWALLLLSLVSTIRFCGSTSFWT